MFQLEATDWRVSAVLVFPTPSLCPTVNSRAAGGIHLDRFLVEVVWGNSVPAVT